MKTIDEMKSCGAKACAQQMYKDGEYLNPYEFQSEQWKEFNAEIRRLEREEFIEMIGGGYAS